MSVKQIQHNNNKKVSTKILKKRKGEKIMSNTLKEILSASCSDYTGTYEEMKEITGRYPAIVFGLRMPLDVAEAFDSAGVDVDALEKALAKKMFSEKKNCTGCKECTCNEKETESDPADSQVTEDKPKGKRGRKPKATAEAEKVEKTESEDTAAENYDGKTAKELFNLCKSRGVICEMKKPASYYKDLLIKADAETNAEDDGDWDEEPEEKPKSKRGRKPKAAKIEEEPEQEPGEEDEEDDDWDI